jgi:gamma-glutamyltranspeptidase / glutathione hydrolase
MRPRCLVLALATVLGLPGALEAASPPTLRGTGGAVVSDHAVATDAGLELLAAGGNATDAAVGVALTLAVVFPEAGNLGGGGFAVLRQADGALASLDFREVGPAAARPNLFLDAKGEPIPGASLVGPLASGVPGSGPGLHELHRRFGKLPWAAVVEPARRLAAEGFAVDLHLAELLKRDRELLARFPETVAQWLPGGAPPPVGTVIRQPRLAATLARYAAEGPSALQEGPIAEAVAAAAARHGGVLSAADLAAYRPAWREPVRFQAFGWELAGMGLPSSGGVVLAQSAALLERWGWAARPRFGAERAHALAEALRRAYASRFRLGDPATSEVQPAALLEPEALAGLAASFEPARATPSERLRPASAPAAESPDTTHLSVIDAAGNAVALTTTLNGLFGCGLYVPELGFLNNEMDDFATAPGRPNLFGLIQGEANAVRPGKRMLSSMSPTIAWRGGETLTFGGRGGSRIATQVLQVLLSVVVDGDPLQDAVNRPRLHHQWLPDQLEAEPDALAPETRAELERRGHKVAITTTTAKVHALARRADGTVEAALEPRGVGRAAVVEELPGVGNFFRYRGEPLPSTPEGPR